MACAPRTVVLAIRVVAVALTGHWGNQQVENHRQRFRAQHFNAPRRVSGITIMTQRIISIRCPSQGLSLGTVTIDSPPVHPFLSVFILLLYSPSLLCAGRHSSF